MLKIEQLLHGYRRGHEQISASVKLPARDAELITRLSDLSGNLSGTPTFSSYLTIYPLPSEDYFALARTWPDHGAVRAGCVLTHTLLVPGPDWSTLGQPIVLDSLFQHPTLAHGINNYASPLALPDEPQIPELRPVDVNEGALGCFVYRYFCEGKRPLVWFIQERTEEILWHILRGLWPRLRASFSACTFSLQQRTLEDRSFDLMFSPPTVSSRFLNMQPDSFIDTDLRWSAHDVDRKDSVWCQQWVKQLFTPSPRWNPPGGHDLWMELDEDPTAIRRLLLLDQILKEGDPPPHALVGAIDLIESVAKNGKSAIISKRRALERAIEIALQNDDFAAGLECLNLISDRLQRASFSGIQNIVGPILQKAIEGLFRKAPGLILELPRLKSPEIFHDTWYGRGFFNGLRNLGTDHPEHLSRVLRGAPEVVRHLIDFKPRLGALYMGVLANKRNNREVRAELLQWLTASVGKTEFRRAVRASIVRILDSENVDLLEAILSDTDADEVGGILDVLWKSTSGFDAPEIIKLIVWKFALVHPMETQVWAAKLTEWTPGAARVFAATFTSTKGGFIELLELGPPLRNVTHRGMAVAAFIENLGKGPYPYWLVDLMQASPVVLATLLEPRASSTAAVAPVIETLLRTIPNLSIAESPQFIQHVLDLIQRPFFPALLDVTMRGLIRNSARRGSTERIGHEFMNSALAIAWLENVEARELASLVSKAAGDSVVNWINSWRWVVDAPEPFYTREPNVLVPIVETLVAMRGSDWTPAATEMWLKVLRRTRSRAGTARISLCAQALEFSFSNPRLPLGAVVSETFFDVYHAVTEFHTVPREAAPLFGIFDWDKGKELRRQLVASFLSSHWQPAHLVLAAKETRLLHKIFKRLIRRRSGETYARAALEGLEERDEANISELVLAWRSMLEARSSARAGNRI